MPVFIRMRLAAIRLARALRRSILLETKHWEIGVDEAERPSIAAGPFRLVIMPRAVRLLDAIHVYCEGAEIWLPLLWRLRLRTAVRLVLAENALEVFDAAKLEVSRKQVRTARRRERRTA
jgi:hypothetical protein